eukprot:Plantae.Rhodophyta-Rhodochaete_pulchella.ctg74034.p1 GENE.Plantae.Rhodophyta-Rhodochaete_pulchella.ctg74034~~Plantae.Rhodophyta-Rhodochaete_pulchella.ctg74034.p1  ORF type:complete len:113 (+),score=10.10 Plantae.Rhodophyta-Rhodochaete_pulchella.ctg74034:75-413(+)
MEQYVDLRHLTDGNQEEMRRLIRKHADLGTYTLLGHVAGFGEIQMDMRDETPCTSRMYRMSLKEPEWLASEIARLLKLSVIEESRSPYSSPVVHVKKPNGSYRLCADYRKVN